ncbi:hypothetical protein B0T22DRAFT_444981 [Podospora appendiculata]|uniref:Nuclear GTPase SLIP-GC n=1 Tax=Podospora appendiculata TaxID=314037 RepID=A0AAE0X249_9PEZI|nr:hypothetical protein B0T22DRAFT_444981 [Podospora appendiculata]
MQDLTPLSSGVSALSLADSGGSQPPAQNPDVPLPSIEDVSNADEESSTAEIDQALRPRTPPISLSPPSSSDSSQATPPSTPGITDNGVNPIDPDKPPNPTPSSSSPSSSPGTPSVTVQLTPRASSTQDSSKPTDSKHLTPSPPPRRSRSPSQSRHACHDVGDEEPPPNRFHDPAFQTAFKDARDLARDLGEVLGSSALHLEPDSTICRLRQRASELAQFKCPPTRTVGFVGDSGVGKSSLINSLLDFRGLARTSGGGSACTCVVTEYRYHDDDSFAVEVELFSTDELEAQLTELVTAYRYYHLRPADMDRESLESGEVKATLARDTFHAMFRGRFDSDRFILDRSANEAVATLLLWAQEMRPADLDGRQLTSEPHGRRGPATWPYIKNISVFLRAHILSNGLVLADLPGLRDRNSARQNITERYLLKCDEILAVCCIGRATTDVGVKAVIDLAKQAELSNVGIICTKADDIRKDESRWDWGGARATGIQTRMDWLDAAKEELSAIEADLDDLDSFEDDLDQAEVEEKSRLDRKARSQRQQIKRLDFDLEHYQITTRNEIVTNSLKRDYGSKLPGGDLAVFCIGNHMYWDHRDLPKNNALPFLELSGILAARRHFVAMVSDSQRRVATNYMDHDVRSLVSSVDLWVQSGAGTASAEQKRAVCQVLDALEARLQRDLWGESSRLSEIARTFREEFEQGIYQQRQGRVAEWTKAARNAGLVWEREFHHSTYLAFCRNYGDHSTERAGTHNWNQEIIQRMVHDLHGHWSELRSALSNRQADLASLVEESMDWAVAFLGTELQPYSSSTPALQETLRALQAVIGTAIEDSTEAFEGNLSTYMYITLKTDALSGIRTSIIGDLMKGSYDRCNDESGRGSHNRRKAIINGTLAQETLFEDLMRAFRKKFAARATELQRNIHNAVAINLRAIRQTLDMVRDENVALESERDPVFRLRVQEQVGAARDALRQIQAVIVS